MDANGNPASASYLLRIARLGGAWVAVLRESVLGQVQTEKAAKESLSFNITPNPTALHPKPKPGAEKH